MEHFLDGGNMTSAGRDEAPGRSIPLLCLENGHTPESAGERATMERAKPTSPPASNSSPSRAHATRHGDDLTFLVEIAKAALPKGRGKRGEGGGSRGMHCTAVWVGPTNPSGRPRREKLLHRTKTLTIGKATSTEAEDAHPSDEDSEEEADYDCTEHIFTVNDDSLFLVKTTMTQLANASLTAAAASVKDSAGTQDSSKKGGLRADARDASSNGGLRVDIYETPLDMLSSAFSTVLASSQADREAHATTRESSSFTGYRLVGSAFLGAEDLLRRCDEQRFECELLENLKQRHQRRDGVTLHGLPQRADGGRLALRLRAASAFDAAFLRALGENAGSTARTNAALQTALITAFADQVETFSQHPRPAQLITDMDESLLQMGASTKALGNMAPIAQESVRYLFSNDAEKRVLVKPFADPAQPHDTTWLTEAGLHAACYRPSTNWIQAGQQAEGGALGRVYLEVLECRGLPNVDAGGAIGNKTDAFISIVYGDIMVQTEVIDDCCSPMWMPWSSRAFVFKMGHPSTFIYVGVTDYDLGPSEHECIGRVAIDVGKLSQGTLYTQTYNLYESSNLTEQGADAGTITVRLRTEVPDEKKYLLEGWKAPGRKYVNSQQWKTHRVAKFCVDGPHDEDVFEMSLFRSHINELLTQKRYLSYAISDAVRSLVFWRGQVKVGSVWLPLHSAIVFYFSIHAIEHPQLLPSFFLFGCGWILIANMLQRASQPNPWKRGPSFADHFNVLTHGTALHKAGQVIRPNQGHKEEQKLESKWKQRFADDDAEHAKQAELTAKIKSVSDDAIIRTRAKGNTTFDPISAVAGARLLPYQQMLSRYCNKVRYIRNVMSWNESILSFFFTLALFGAGCVALFVPWRFLLRWTARLLVWGGLGPWMWMIDLFFHEESELQKAKAAKKAMKLFREQHKMAKGLREQAIKMKAFRVKLFGKFITRLPEFNLTRHEDVPLPQSFAEPYHSEEEIKTVQFVPSQDLSGTMIPMTGQDAVERKLRMKEEKEQLLQQYQEMMNKNAQIPTPTEDETEAGFELVTSKSENQLLCLRSEPEPSTVDAIGTGSSGEIAHARSNSVREIVVSDKAIQSALENELGEFKKSENPKKKWIFSAQVKFSLTQETAQVNTPATPSLCNGTDKELLEGDAAQKKLLIDNVQEEGVEVVEVVPFLGPYHAAAESDTSLQPENGSDNVSVLYVKDGTKKELENDSQVSVLYVDGTKKTVDESLAQLGTDTTMNGEREARDDGNITLDAVKRIRVNEALSEID